MPTRNRQPPNRRNMSRQTQLQLPTRQIPNLNNPIPRTRREPLIPRLDRNAPHPAKMSGDDTHEFPLRVKGRFDCACGFVEGEGLGEVGGVGEGGGGLGGCVVDCGDHAGGVVGGGGGGGWSMVGDGINQYT